MDSLQRKQRLSSSYMLCKEMMQNSGASYESIARIDDIMLASIRTLDFIWLSCAEEVKDDLMHHIIYQFAVVANSQIDMDIGEIYQRLTNQTDAH